MDKSFKELTSNLITSEK